MKSPSAARRILHPFFLMLGFKCVKICPIKIGCKITKIKRHATPWLTDKNDQSVKSRSIDKNFSVKRDN